MGTNNNKNLSRLTTMGNISEIGGFALTAVTVAYAVSAQLVDIPVQESHTVAITSLTAGTGLIFFANLVKIIDYNKNVLVRVRKREV